LYIVARVCTLFCHNDVLNRYRLQEMCGRIGVFGISLSKLKATSHWARLCHFTATGLEANPLEPARAKWTSQFQAFWTNFIKHLIAKMIQSLGSTNNGLLYPFASSGLERIGPRALWP
jgi:hypothetical protein